MKRLAALIPCIAALGMILAAPISADEKDKDKKEKTKELVASHKQVSTIDVCKDNKRLGLNAFCLDSSGNILAAVGQSVAVYGRTKESSMKLERGVRVFNKDGEKIATWPLEFTPQAIGFGPDNHVYVGGEGKIAKLDRNGKVLKMVDAPNLGNREELIKKLKAEHIKRQKSLKKTYERLVKTSEKNVDSTKDKIAKLEKQIEEIDDEDEDAEAEAKKLNRRLKTYKRQLSSYERSLKAYKRYIANTKNTEMSEAQVEQMILRKSKISSISATNEGVFVACQATEGYGFDVWRTDNSFENAKKVVKNLSGCCGQMDVQTRADGIYVAENSRHRVVHYGFDGKKIHSFGKRDAKGKKGFGSCCNPMNVCFCKDNLILTAESGTGRIMQFNTKGERVGLIGNGKITGGCKNVAVHATHDLSTVYMLDLTGRKICVLRPRKETETSAEKSEGEKDEK